MKVHWNEVTWFSKVIALILFVVLPFAGFFYGVQFGQMLQQATPTAPGEYAPVPMPSQGNTNSGSDYYQNVSAWQTNRHDDARISIAYPIDFPVDDSHALTPSADWSVSGAATITGLKVLSLSVPATFEPQTNFSEAKLTVGYSNNALATSQCLKNGQNGGSVLATSTATINGIHFVVFRTGDAGAGNLYDTTSYRTIHDGYCYAVEYTIHSTQLANYPKEYGLHQFDQIRVSDLMDRIVGTFKFL